MAGERRPYEADGIIAATARLLVQRDVLWARHSHAWVLQNPTWPVEWKQISPFLGYQDFMWTGQPDLALAFAPQSMPLWHSNPRLAEHRQALLLT